MIKYAEDIFEETKQLCCGVFWVITDNDDLSDSQLLVFDIPCNPDGSLENKSLPIELNSKKGNSYNHKKLWDAEIKNNSKHKPYNKKDFDYYPRGRVEISHNKATIFLNPNININSIVQKIKQMFGLSTSNIPMVKIIADGSTHYQCWTDR